MLIYRQKLTDQMFLNNNVRSLVTVCVGIDVDAARTAVMEMRITDVAYCVIGRNAES